MIYLARKQTSKGWFSLVSQSESESESELQEHLSSSENCHKWSHTLDRIRVHFSIQFVTPPYDPVKTRLLKLEVEAEEPTNVKARN